MKNIYEVLKQKETEYASLMSQYRKLGENVSTLGREIEAVKTTVKLLGDAEDQSSDEQSVALSQPQMIRAVLAEHKKEMHLSEILGAVELKFHVKLKPNVTAAVIFRYAKRGSIFYKAPSKPNTWGLLSFRAQDPKAESIFDIVDRVERRA
jgi:predicted nuclease with TOPRIM domain